MTEHLLGIVVVKRVIIDFCLSGFDNKPYAMCVRCI